MNEKSNMSINTADTPVTTFNAKYETETKYFQYIRGPHKQCPMHIYVFQVVGSIILAVGPQALMLILTDYRHERYCNT